MGFGGGDDGRHCTARGRARGVEDGLGIPADVDAHGEVLSAEILNPSAEFAEFGPIDCEGMAMTWMFGLPTLLRRHHAPESNIVVPVVIICRAIGRAKHHLVALVEATTSDYVTANT